ncbi:hypothetical protein [Streptomyces sp. NPDC018693]|uniref:hypothetical protein n=1 Tax=unclassified Streptomyces TaxID=2593676 RepID=UPI0037BCE34A
MRRTVRVLAVSVLGGAVLGVAPVAYAEPAVEVSPASVEPGGSVTVSVSCDPLGGPAPKTMDATSQAFAEDTVELQKVSANDDELSGPAYRGTARIADAAAFADVDGTGPDSAWTVDGTCPVPPGGQGQPWSATFDVTRTGPSHGPSHRPAHVSDPSHRPDQLSGDPLPDHLPDAAPDHLPDAVPDHLPDAAPDHRPDPVLDHLPDHLASRSPCPSPHGSPPPRPSSCGGAVVQRGVRAGEGGAFTDSVPALVAGGALIAGALGAAVHRLWRRGTMPGA